MVVVNRAGGKLTFSVTQVARVQERKNYREFAGATPAAATSGLGSLGDLLRDKLKGAGADAGKGQAAKPGPTAGVTPGPKAGSDGVVRRGR